MNSKHEVNNFSEDEEIEDNKDLKFLSRYVKSFPLLQKIIINFEK